MNIKKGRIWLLLLILSVGVISLYLMRDRIFQPREKADAGITTENDLPVFEDFSYLRIYYPAEDGLRMVEKKIPKRTKQIALAEAVIEEFFKGNEDSRETNIPKGVKFLGLYRDDENILYIDLSDELRRNFQGDALSEYLILKGIYESLISNLRDFNDFKILVDGKELETLGGHFYLKYKLKSTVITGYEDNSRLSDE